MIPDMEGHPQTSKAQPTQEQSKAPEDAIQDVHEERTANRMADENERQDLQQEQHDKKRPHCSALHGKWLQRCLPPASHRQVAAKMPATRLASRWALERESGTESKSKPTNKKSKLQLLI